jgi:hypothetical protein
MDNASFHNKYELVEIAKDYGITIVFLGVVHFAKFGLAYKSLPITL